MTRYHFLVFTVLLSCAGSALAQTQEARCFSFTWLGPRYNNESVFLNATCDEATKLAQGVPCQHPLVVSENGTWPDIHYIWNNYGQEVTCVLASNDVCAQYTYYFNGHVENSTYLCTRVIDNNDQAITNGCYEQRNGSFVTRACFCRSIPGGIPCNAAPATSTISIVAFVFAITISMKGILLDNNRI